MSHLKLKPRGRRSIYNTVPLIDSVIDLGAEFFDTHRNNLTGKSRIRAYADPRRIIMYFIKAHIAGASDEIIAEYFNMTRSAVYLITEKLNSTIEFELRIGIKTYEFERYVFNRLPI